MHSYSILQYKHHKKKHCQPPIFDLFNLITASIITLGRNAASYFSTPKFKTSQNCHLLYHIKYLRVMTSNYIKLNFKPRF